MQIQIENQSKENTFVHNYDVYKKMQGSVGKKSSQNLDSEDCSSPVVYPTILQRTQIK